MNVAIYELADLQIAPADAAGFEQSVRQAEPFFIAAPGCLSFALRRSIEHPGRYQLVVGWTNVEAHTVHFRASQGFQEWRRLVGGYFTAAPAVHHVEEVIGNG